MGNHKYKRKRSQSPPRPSHCFSCDQKMNLSMCSIDWVAVFVAKNFQDFLEENNHDLPTQQQLTEIRDASQCDPCETCCCYACGSRKYRPGDTCC